MVELVGETEIRDVRLVGVNAEVNRIPTEMTVEFKAGQVAVQQNDSEIVAHFEHSVHFANPAGEQVATISLLHAARFSYTEDLALDEQSVGNWVFGNVYFMVYPYVRQALQDTCLRLGLPAVVLGYLKRGETAPESISLVINTTSLTQKRGEEEPLPLDEDTKD
jgi:hypothetical protein